MSLTVDDFEAFHRAVHGRAPFSWQARLLRQVVEQRRWPRVLDLPTGAGKTTCIDIALFALALDAQHPGDRWCPRRIAMVVDRRVVVDQVAARGRKLLEVLLTSTATSVVEVARLLRSLSREAAEPIGVFTLRGGMPKDDTWARAPDQPLILASTVDQLGSRLLMQGYGVSQGMKPVHAGLIGNDLLLLLDEVHLSEPFRETLEQLDRLRARRGAIAARFQHAFLSATPGASAELPFRLLSEETIPDSPLGPRLHAPKPVRLDEAEGRVGVELTCVQHARRLIDHHRVMAVVVNRVASAGVIARQLREAIGATVDVRLLTGRMRPLDRDDALAELLPRIATGRDRASTDRKLIVVATQCIEAGADFDFDALVTEAASFDALRQRFGRVDRLGLYKKADGVIVRDKTAKEDPVYGASLAKTMSWLKERLAKKSKAIDFGVCALPAPSSDELPAMLAPKAHAPVLLPAYLDLWMQTSPPPIVVPDPSLWLHGPASGPADVQVIWRADLTEDLLRRDPRSAIEIVSAVRPSSLEAISLPFVVVLRWLCGDEPGDLADVEGEALEAGDGAGGMFALRWAGDDSAVISAGELRPGDTIVVPADRGGLRERCFDASSPARVHDLAERASLVGRGVPVLRLHSAVLENHALSIPIDDAEDARARLRDLVDVEPPGWRRLWLARLAASRDVIVVERPETWIILKARRLHPAVLRAVLNPTDTLEDGLELSTDGEDSFHAGRPVPLDEHSKDVESVARAFALAAGLPPELVEDIALAGWLHDIGKADRRFQIMLRGGSEIAYYRNERPWAKSGMPPGAKAAHRLARERSGYPRDARHEVQSIAMLRQHEALLRTKARDLDLVLHLVASHHGYCRPFAPPAVDDKPVDVVLEGHHSEVFGRLDFSSTTSAHAMGRIDAPIADRFWRLVERYGWLEVCWLEALMRLADHRASEAEQEVRDEA